MREKESYWGWLRVMLPNPTTATLLAAILFVRVAAISLLTNAVIVSVNRLGWSQLNAITTSLPGNAVYQVLALPDGHMLMATDKGVGIWKSGGTEADTWEIYNQQNSGLPDDEVLSVAQDDQGGLWLGTRSGLAYYDGRSWQTISGQEMGLAGDDILALETVPGGLWVASNIVGI